MKTNIYFVRHAEPDYSVHDDATRPLTQKGKLAAIKVASYFMDKEIDIVLSSPYKRAIDTIKPFADKSDLEIRHVFDFRERKIDSCWIEDFIGFTKKQWSDFDYKLSDGESLSEVQNRNVTALKGTLEKYSGKNIIIGSHGTALSTIINHFDPTFGYDDFEKIRILMPWIVKFSFENNILSSIEKINI
jgi:2,3-bisphosphoglycerate-dependent phosphoglycerate mutase